MKNFYLTIFSLFAFSLSAQDEVSQLTGEFISNLVSPNHQVAHAFDGDPDTYFGSNSSAGWVGYDFGDSCVITKIRFMRTTLKETFMKGGWIEGANSLDFSDAVPLYIIREEPEMGAWNDIDVSFSLGFRYVRYKGPSNDYSRIAELQFYGKPGPGDDTKMYSPFNIPVILINCEDNAVPYDKVNEIPSVVTGLMPNGKKFIQETAGVRLRGNYSSGSSCPKKSYRIKFNNSKKFFGSPAKAKKWTLIPNYGDKSLIRNQLSFDISERFGMTYTPFHLMVHLYLNGEYRGVYQLCDQVDIRSGRLDITEMGETDVEGEELTGGYFLEIDGYANQEEWWFTSNRSIPITIKSPDDPPVAAQKDYISNHFNKMESLAFAQNYNVETGYHQYLDLPSFLKRHLHQELVANPDAVWSCFMYKERGDDKFYTGPVWDHDLAFDNDNRYHDNINNNRNWSYTFCSKASSSTVSLWNNILADSTAQHKMQAEWARLRCTKAVDYDKLNKLIDDYYAMLGGEAQEMNFTRWDILNTTVHQNYTARGSFKAEVDYLREYLSKRIPWMDTKLQCVENTFEMTMTDAKWSTLYIPFAAEIPEGLTVYTVVGTTGNKLVKEEVSLIEPFTPYLVNGEEGTYTISGYSIPDWDRQVMGLLTGTSKEMTALVDSYVMQKVNGVVCFRKVIDIRPKITPHKCYLFPPYFVIEGAPERLQIDDEETNELDVIESESHNGILRVFGLNGTLVYEGNTGDADAEEALNSLPKGVYVVTLNGKEYKKIVRK